MPDPRFPDPRLASRYDLLVRTSLDRTGFAVVDVRDAPDRPGAEHVVVAALSR